MSASDDLVQAQLALLELLSLILQDFWNSEKITHFDTNDLQATFEGYQYLATQMESTASI